MGGAKYFAWFGKGDRIPKYLYKLVGIEEYARIDGEYVLSNHAPTQLLQNEYLTEISEEDAAKFETDVDLNAMANKAEEFAVEVTKAGQFFVIPDDRVPDDLSGDDFEGDDFEPLAYGRVIDIITAENSLDIRAIVSFYGIRTDVDPNRRIGDLKISRFSLDKGKSSRIQRLGDIVIGEHELYIAKGLVYRTHFCMLVFQRMGMVPNDSPWELWHAKWQHAPCFLDKVAGIAQKDKRYIEKLLRANDNDLSNFDPSDFK
jgi:hypothetical protein